LELEEECVTASSSLEHAIVRVPEGKLEVEKLPTGVIEPTSLACRSIPLNVPPTIVTVSDCCDEYVF